MTQIPPLIGIVVANAHELEAMEQGIALFKACTVPYEVTIASTHILPDELRDWAVTARERGIQAILAASGEDLHLPAFVASHTILPVIGIPLGEDILDEGEALDSVVRTPPGIPVATAGVDAAINSAMFAIEILARFDQRWESSILKYRMHLRDRFRVRAAEALDRKDDNAEQGSASPPRSDESHSSAIPANEPVEPIRADSPRTEPQIPPAMPVSPVSPSAFASAREEQKDSRPGYADSVPHTDKPGLKREAQHIGRIKVDSEMIPIDVAESATDCLLDGGIVALPTDTVYGLAVDATNPDAINALCELKGRDADRPIAIFIESQRQLAALVRNLSGEVRQMLEAFWPGPLTVVFERRSQDFDYLSPGNTIGVRLPDHSVALALLQELRRPIACSSANPSGAPSARSADEVEQYFGEDVHMILDAGKLPPRTASTVIDVTRIPFRILREGPITRAQLGAVLGDLLEADEGD